MTERRGGQWTSPEKQQDEKYRKKMEDFFAPGGGVRGPLKDDTTVIPSVGATGARGGAQNGHAAAPASDAIPGPRRPGLGRLLLAGVPVLVGVLFVVLLAWLVFGRGGGEAREAERAPVAAGAAAPAIEETNQVFEAVDGEGDAYAVRLGEYEWEGTEAMNGDVEEVVLEGRTAAHFTTAVRLAEGEIQTGVFGRAEPGKPMWHATFQRTTTGGQQTTTGTYTVVEDEKVILEGAYTDRVVKDNPEGEPDRIVREYVEGDPAARGRDVERFRVSFDAEEGVEIPWLPGHPIAETAEGEAR